MEHFAKGIIRFRIPILVIAAVITVAFGTVLPRLFADDDVMQFLPADDPEIKLFRRVTERFGGLDVAIVGLESDDLFTPKRLKQVRRLTERIGEVDGVFDVLSFTEAPDAVPSPFGLVVKPLIGQVPTSSAELAELKKRVLANENARGNLISEDGQAAMVLCFLGGKRPPIHIAADIKAEATSVWKDKGIYFGGAPFIRLHVAGGTKRDLVRLTPLVALVVLIVTFFIFRKPMGVLLALGGVGVALIWLMGMLALRGKGITLVGSSLPTLLVAIGGAYGIHILSAYFSGTSNTVKERVVETIREVGAPVTASVLTTCAGFSSFVVMDVAPLREFGVTAAIGVAITGLLAITVIPAVLSFSGRVPSSLGAARLAYPLGRIGGWSATHRKPAIVVGILLAVISLVGVFRIAPDATLENFFKKGSEPDEANKFLERHFGGSSYLQVYFEGDMRSPFVLAELRKLVEFVKGMDEVVQVSSIIEPLKMMSEAMGGRADLPLNRDRTRSLFPFLEGTAAIDQIVSPEKDAGLIQIRLGNIGPKKANQTIARLKAFVKAEIPRGVKAIALLELPPEEQIKRAKQMKAQVAKRVVRLARIYGEKTFADKAALKVADVLASQSQSNTLAPGPDLKQAVGRVIDEHVIGEAAPFEQPAPEHSEATSIEWEKRGQLAVGAINPIARQPGQIDKIEEALKKALPLTSSRDPEGLELTAEAIAAGLAMARSSVLAGRLVQPVLKAAGVTNPKEALKTRVLWALTDISAPAFGFPDDTKDASRILSSVTGQPVINVAFCESAIRNQIRSLILAFVVLAVILSCTFRSVITALKALVPPIFMLAFAVGIMGAISIPIDLSTSMIAAIALGIGIDYAIHFLWRRRRRGESLAQTTAHVGPSIASNAIQVAAGFAVMALSDMVPMQRFGLLVALTMLLSAIATFVLLPALRAEGTVAFAEEETEGAETVTSSPH